MVSTSILIYAGHFFSSWGDRMWHFAIPLFLLQLEPHSLALSAAYGLTLACSVLLFSPVVGDWIDRNPRLYVARISLVIQNLAVILCAILLLLNLKLGDKDASYIIGVKIGAIVLGAISQLASVSTSIIIQKDWVVVVASGKKDTLASLNSMVRRIDLTTKILAPLACGQLMAVADLFGGAIFISSWNAFSMCCEYILLKMVYDRTPALAIKNHANEHVSEEMVELQENIQQNKFEPDNEENSNMQENESKEKAEEEEEENDLQSIVKQDENTKKNKPKSSVLRNMFSFVIAFKTGIKLYWAQDIVLPCLGFSFLYMTVIGFGYITTTYAYSQCFSEFFIGILLAAAAVTGIIATFMYPVMRKRLGLVRTGLFNALFQTLTLVLCIVSVFVAGSPLMFLPENQSSSNPQLDYTTTIPSVINTSVVGASNVTSQVLYTTSAGTTQESRLFIKCLKGINPPSSFLSLSLLMTGIVLARIGLWGFDLTITQLIQENVKENERGIFNGVQTSLNNFMDMIRYILVIVMPLPSQFGILVILSSLSVCIGYILYCIYARRVRGHLMPHCNGHSIQPPNGSAKA